MSYTRSFTVVNPELLAKYFNASLSGKLWSLLSLAGLALETYGGAEVTYGIYSDPERIKSGLIKIGFGIPLFLASMCVIKRDLGTPRMMSESEKAMYQLKGLNHNGEVYIPFSSFAQYIGRKYRNNVSLKMTPREFDYFVEMAAQRKENLAKLIWESSKEGKEQERWKKDQEARNEALLTARRDEFARLQRQQRSNEINPPEILQKAKFNNDVNNLERKVAAFQNELEKLGAKDIYSEIIPWKNEGEKFKTVTQLSEKLQELKKVSNQDPPLKTTAEFVKELGALQELLSEQRAGFDRAQERAERARLQPRSVVTTTTTTTTTITTTTTQSRLKRRRLDPRKGAEKTILGAIAAAAPADVTSAPVATLVANPAANAAAAATPSAATASITRVNLFAMTLKAPEEAPSSYQSGMPPLRIISD